MVQTPWDHGFGHSPPHYSDAPKRPPYKRISKPSKLEQAYDKLPFGVQEALILVFAVIVIFAVAR